MSTGVPAKAGTPVRGDEERHWKDWAQQTHGLDHVPVVEEQATEKSAGCDLMVAAKESNVVCREKLYDTDDVAAEETPGLAMVKKESLPDETEKQKKETCKKLEVFELLFDVFGLF